MAEHTDPEDTLTYDTPAPPVPEPVEAPEPDDDADEPTDDLATDPKKPRLNKGAKKK